MPFSSGTFTLVAGNPVVTGTTISSTTHNNTESDIATGLTTCVLKDGTQATTASVPFVFGIAVTTAMTTPSTTFALVNTTATTLNFAGAATTMNIGAAASDTTWTGKSFSLTGANSTNNTSFTIQNTSNSAAASHAYQDIAVGGTTSTGDPHTRWTIPSGTSWYAGPDNSDSDTLKIGTGTAVGTNPLLTLTSTGAMTITGGTGIANLTLTSGTATELATHKLVVSKYDNDATTSQVFVLFTINAGGTGCGQINANGASTAAFGSASDRTLKENIVSLPPQLDNILKLKPVEFDYIAGGHQIGFIAQDMQEIYPETVARGKDGKLNLTGWSKTDARIVSAIQGLAARVFALEAKIN